MGDGPDESGLSRRRSDAAIDGTLGRLQTDYLDIYYFHQPDYDVPIEESLEAMARLGGRRKGSLRSVFKLCGLAGDERDRFCSQHNWAVPWISQPMYNLVARGIEQEYLPMAKHFGVSTAVYNPLAGGLLTGKQSREQPLAGTRFQNNQMYLDRYWHPQYFDAVEELHVIASTVAGHWSACPSIGFSITPPRIA